MVQEILPLLPDALTTPQALLSLAALIAGVFLWLTGAAWSRGIVTLIAVAVGALIGMNVPRWYLWPVNSMAMAVLGAVGFGLSAFLIERLWVGLTLGVVLACWTTFAVWVVARPADFVWPERAAWEVQALTPPQYARDVFLRVPDDVREVLPYAAGTALLSGLALALLFPRLGRVMCMSVTGVTLAFLFGLLLVSTQRSGWLAHVPPQPVAQIGILAGMVMMGVLAQWPFSGPKETKRDREQESRDADAAAGQQLKKMFA